MIQICYVSNASPGTTAATIEDILNFARVENRLVGITGLLLFNGKRFLQILEGDETEVMNIFHRIKRDRRHSHVMKIAAREITVREFGDWDMAYERLPDTGAPDYLQRQVGRMTSLASPPVKALFQSFAAL